MPAEAAAGPATPPGTPPAALRVALGTALAYALTGWLALTLAAAPGYASPLYPPAGIALAAALVYGAAALPGVALGSFAANLLLSVDRGVGAVPTLLVPALIGLGAALQAGVGAALVRRALGGTLALTEPRELARFFVLGAPLACLVSASVATAVLAGADALAGEPWWHTWRTWWLGDALGVLVGAPIALTLIGRPRTLWTSRRVSVALPLLLATVLLAAAWIQVSRAAERRLAADFERDALALADAVSDRLQEPLYALQALHGLYVAQHEVSREQFRRASAEWLAQPLFLQAAGFSVALPRARVADLEQAARADGLDGYRVFDRADGVPTADDPQVVAIRFIEPLAGNAGALGVNALSIPAARAAILAAAERGSAVATAGFRLTQSAQDETGLVVYRAVYDGAPGTDPAARRAALRGVVFVTLRVESMLAERLAASPRHLHWCVVDLERATARPRLAGPVGCETRVARPLARTQAIAFAGRQVEVRVDAAPGELPGAADSRGWLLSAVGVGGAALLGALLLVVSGRQQRVEQLVDERTAALRHEAGERERATAALRDSERRLRNILDHVPIGVLYGDTQGRIREANPRLAEMLGLAPDTLAERTIDEITHPDDRAEDALLLGQLLAGARPLVQRRKRLLAADGRVLSVQMGLTVLRDEAGQPQRLVGVVEDIGDQLRLAQAESARERAEAASRAQGELVSRMGHELRTPLNAMLGYAQLLAIDRNPRLGAHQQRWTEEIQRAGWHLLSLIDETLDLARLESGTLRLETAPVAVTPWLDAARAALAGAAAQCGAAIECRVEPGLGPVWGDRARLEQLLGHLLAAALRQTPRGDVVRVEARGDGDGHVLVEVRDGSRGPDAGQLASMFEPFAGGGEAGAAGAGLGLALGRRLAERMGGSLSARADGSGRGVVFTLRLARAAGAGAGVPGDAPAEAAGAAAERALVHYIEDNATNVEVMRAILALRPELQLEVSTLGLDALNAIRARPPRLILLDMQLPDIDGLDLLRQLRQDAATAAIPVLVVSADAATPRIEQALAAGAAGYAGKPLDIPQFLATVDRLLRAASSL